MAKVNLEIPEEVVQSLKMAPQEVALELRKELAIALYQREVLSLGKARALVQMTRWQFQELLGQRKIPQHYTEQDLEEDLSYAHSNQ